MNNVNNQFEHRSVSLTLLLCVCSFGLYLLVALYKLTQQTKKHSQNAISNSFVWCAIASHLVAFGSLLIYFFAIDNQLLLIFSKGMHLVSSIFHLVWIIKVRNALHCVVGAKRTHGFWLNPFLSSFLHVIYFQFKLNQFIAQSSAGLNSHSLNHTPVKNKLA